MIVTLHIDNCGGCHKPVEYRKEAAAPGGWVFRCTNVMCGYYGNDYMPPTQKALRFYVPQKEDAA